jgi:hypothetical protein
MQYPRPNQKKKKSFLEKGYWTDAFWKKGHLVGHNVKTKEKFCIKICQGRTKREVQKYPKLPITVEQGQLQHMSAQWLTNFEDSIPKIKYSRTFQKILQ